MTWIRVGMLLVVSAWATAAVGADDPVPRAEHPTPDAVRPHWSTLNGRWQFRFDPRDEGRAGRWFEPGAAGFDQTIVVPFGWESALSGIKRTDYRGVAWYRRTLQVPADFPANEHVWIHFGAVDWRADVWVNGRHVAEHEGGYTPFSADLSEVVERGAPVVVVVRVEDRTDPGLPTGKQVGWYTPTSGIWQTVWLESRPAVHIQRSVIRTAIAPAGAQVEVTLSAPVERGKYRLVVRSEDPTVASRPVAVEAATDLPGQAGARGVVPVEVREPRLWSPETPHLYPVSIALESVADGKAVDTVATYFGLRTIARGRYGDAPYERLLLNGKPIYLRAALDQSFNPEGIYTAPSDDFLKRDIELAKSFGLNAIRIHIKPDEPRRLYWADRLGLLVLEDMPNTWQQNARARTAWEATMREAIARDVNHPSIVVWVAFNETWGLGAPPQYKGDKDTQAWVDRMVSSIRALDPTRLVEDNSPCNYDHVENTDLNSWHFYIDDHEQAKNHIEDVVARTAPGSTFNYCPDRKQGTAPLINSEYGSVSAGGGDRDVSWGFRDLTTLLRRQAKIQGYVYTELSDIEWEHNGFLNYDRSPKRFGYDAFVDGMTVADLQGADFIGYDSAPTIEVAPGQEITVPVFVSHFADRAEPPRFSWSFRQFLEFGAVQEVVDRSSRPIAWKAYDVTQLAPVKVRVGSRPGVGSLGLMLHDSSGKRIAANFVNIVVKQAQPLPTVERVEGDSKAVVVRFGPGEFAQRRWSGPRRNAPGKAVGWGAGAFEYHLKLPEAVVKAGPRSVVLWAEMASKANREKVEWADRKSSQDYPQTDVHQWPSTVRMTVNGVELASSELRDDPADARGVLSHLARRDHGSYGERISLGGTLPEGVQKDLAAGKPLVVRLEVPEGAARTGGLSIFGATTGAYGFDPSLVVGTRDPLPSDLPEQTASVAIDTVAGRQITVLPWGDSDRESATWAYTTSDPGEGWNGREFNDGTWKKGKSGFGRGGTPAGKFATPWETNAIWLRTTVDLPALDANDVLTFTLFHDEDVEIFVNGKRVLKRSGYVTKYVEEVLDAGQKGLFQRGQNVIAVVCRQTTGGQGVDVGLTLDRGDR